MELEIIPKEEMIETINVKNQFFLIEKKLTHTESTYGLFFITEENKFLLKFYGLGESIAIIDKMDNQKISSSIIKANCGDYRLRNLDKLFKKHNVRVGDVIKFYVDTNNKQIFVDFVNIEVKKLVYIESRNQVILALNVNLLKSAGFEPGSRVNIIYSKDKIKIEKCS